MRQITEDNSLASGEEAKEVLEFLTAYMRGELRDISVDKSGERVEKPAPIKDRMKAAELLGKHYGVFSGKPMPGSHGTVCFLSDFSGKKGGA